LNDNREIARDWYHPWPVSEDGARALFLSHSHLMVIRL
jgi:hypothetical protein